MAEVTLHTRHQTTGRALFTSPTGTFYLSRRYRIYRSSDYGAHWTFDCEVPTHGWKALASQPSLGARLLRYNIQALQVLNDGTRVAVARDGIYYAPSGQTTMRRTWELPRGSRPFNLSADGNRLLFGEYGGAEMDSLQVRLYCSEDDGQHFEPVYEFPKGDVHHIHNVVVDPYSNHYWVLAGDHGRTPGIAALSKDFRHVDWIARGTQLVRAVSVLTRPDCLIYGTDSELQPNYIVRLDRKSGQLDKITAINGSSLYAANAGKCGLISTCVEPSTINTGRVASLYASTDDQNWSELVSLRKDAWHSVLFQFGLIVLPSGNAGESSKTMFSGQALQNAHDQLTIFEAPN